MNKALKCILIPIYNCVRNRPFWYRGFDIDKGRNVILGKVNATTTGTGNRIVLEKDVRLENCNFVVSGNNNQITISEGCSLCGTNFCIEDDNNKILVGAFSTITGDVDLCAIEGTQVILGHDCMLSRDIYISTGDGHSVISNELRTNKSRDVLIGNHVWIGTKVILNKGVTIPDNSIVAAGSVVSYQSFDREGIVIAGNPAVEKKRGINWNRERIKQSIE